MSEFHQYASIATLHDLFEIFDRDEYLHFLEKKLGEFSNHMRMCLLLPCLRSELENQPVIQNILDQIREVDYLRHIVVAFGATEDPAHFRQAREFFGQLEKDDRDVRLVWVDGPRIRAIYDKIEDLRIDTGEAGKGRSVWMTLGYIFARQDSEVIALHDCDIVTYDRLLLGRLIEPTANPNNDFEFCKGYYSRVSLRSRQMKGRVTRIFVAPFVETLASLMRNRGYTDLENFFRYHRSFRYPLSGEFSFATRLAKSVNVAHDWALEVSTLSEVFQRVVNRKIAQIDLARNYEHKHKEISEEDSSKGLHRMVVDIARFYLNHVRSSGFPLTDQFIDMLKHTYVRQAWFFIKKYGDDAASNGLPFERHTEELTANLFMEFLGEAWELVKRGEVSEPIPSWNRVAYSFPAIYRDILEAVEKDHTI